MRISVLIENTTKSELCCEHGLSVLIEYKDEYYLLDAGQSGVAMENAVAMKLPLHNVKYGVLSHGHYDHAGGFATCLAEYKDMKIYAMKQAQEEYYSGSGGRIHYIGVPKEILTNYNQRFVYIERVTQIAEDIYLIPHSTMNLEKVGERTQLYRKVNDEYMPDDFSHELSLVFDTEQGLVVLNSCSHGGICNIIDEVKTVLPDRKLYAFLGGLHMKGTKDGEEICTFSEKEVQQFATYLRNQGLQKLYTGHCTGTVGLEMLKKELNEMVIPLHTGMEILL